MTEIHPRILKRLETEPGTATGGGVDHACRRLRKERLIIGGLADTAIGSELHLPELCEVLDDALVTLAALVPSIQPLRRCSTP